MAKTVLVLILLSFCGLVVQAQVPTLTKVDLNGTEIHYIEKGAGEPLILLHGGVGDYRSWEPQFDIFAKQYRVISYSRRYSFPNSNKIQSDYRPGFSDADDLAALLRKLGLKRVHLVGLSYGAFTGLLFAVKYPEQVASLVMVEPPAHQLIRDVRGGEAKYQAFRNDLKPVVEAFKANDERLAMKHFNRLMGRDMDKLAKPVVEGMLENAPALKAINLSADPFPMIAKVKLRRLRIPSLIVKGQRTPSSDIHAMVADEVARLMSGKTVIVPNAGHATSRDNPEFFNCVVLDFLMKALKK
jgi:esterase